ncbi:SAF domain-containing protein [Trueperella bialowiezensis]|uniref:Flp pilus assembly protein CpaB n=1 Tax=Trueperella bialowiezensis TaxID=312285 RepID=A0A3S5EW47_9ACTO|nr:SAF domain-containing protein [Trueperella bialowiezensis]VEI13718.1 Flp pilus assembly protein CpaB [Trueperella bialowiezensis]
MTRLTPWKDPRLAIGIVLIAGGGLAGSLLLSGEETIPVLRASQPIAAGTPVDHSQFTIAELPKSVGSAYVLNGELADGAIAAHSVGEGELLAHSALTGEHDGVDLAVPLLAELPASIEIGDSVEVWRVRAAQFDEQAQAHRIAGGAVVIAVEPPSTTGVTKAHIRVAPADVPAILEVLGTQDGLVLVGDAR